MSRIPKTVTQVRLFASAFVCVLLFVSAFPVTISPPANMAEQPTTSDAQLHSRKHSRTSPDASISCPSLSHERIRASKRLRTNSSKALERPEIIHPTSPEIVYERRRVNPESLALRLGPELVGELNALIVPGNRDMPSFAVRKELQERYNIDRRHLYDYFHSKGLRVVKEDKHGHPIRHVDHPNVVAQVRFGFLVDNLVTYMLP